jgi:hypothetical protein
MREIARNNKLDILGGKIPESIPKETNFDGNSVKLMLTFDVFHNKLFWHLSLSLNPRQIIPHELAVKIAKIFFDNSNIIEIPSLLHGPYLKQFISPVKGFTNSAFGVS